MKNHLTIEQMLHSAERLFVSARNEQHMAFKVYGADWSPVDCDGLQLIKRPKEAKEGSFVGTPRKGWSNASK